MRIRLSVCLIAMLYAAADVDDTIVAEDLELSAIEETVASQGAISKVIYSSGTTDYRGLSATTTGTIGGVSAGTTYNVKVEVLRNDLGSADEKVSSIKLNGTPIGSCNPDGGDYDCTFYNCVSSNHQGQSRLTKTTYTPTGTTINVEMVYTGHSHDCDCDTSSWQCSRENTVAGRIAMTAVARLTLTPQDATPGPRGPRGPRGAPGPPGPALQGIATKGSGNIAQGGFSTAMGARTKAKGGYSTSLGDETTAQGAFSTAMGYKSRAEGGWSTSMGYHTRAEGDFSTSLGWATKAKGDFSTTMGKRTIAQGKYSTSMGFGVTATAEGTLAVSGGLASEVVLVAADQRLVRDVKAADTAKMLLQLQNLNVVEHAPSHNHCLHKGIDPEEGRKHRKAGLLAHEVEVHIPKAVSSASSMRLLQPDSKETHEAEELEHIKDVKSLDMQVMLAQLVGAVQEQQKTIEMINKQHAEQQEQHAEQLAEQQKQHAEQQKQLAEFKTEATKRIAELEVLQKH